MNRLLINVLTLGSLITSALAVTVPGTSDPWLAGMPDGSLDNVGTPEPADVAPTHSPVFAFPVTPGTVISWSATGIVGHPGEDSGADGASITGRAIGANNGISDLIAPINGLLGVFLGPDQPDLSPAPATLDFSTLASQDYSSLSPLLQQAFFMGDGLGTGGLQSIVAPAGATRLFLGVMDGYGWANNTGAFEVTLTKLTSVPDSNQYGWLVMVGVLLLGTAARQRRET